MWDKTVYQAEVTKSNNGSKERSKEIENLVCPIESFELNGRKCRIVSCIYNKNNTCCHSTLSSYMKSAGDNAEKRLEVVSTFFNVERDEVEVAKARIKALLVLDEYFYYTFSKTVLEAKASELESLKCNKNRFEDWASRMGSPITFEGLEKAILFLKTNLR